MTEISRRQFVSGVTAVAAGGLDGSARAETLEERLERWQIETDKVSSAAYKAYFLDGDTRGFKSLERLEQAFEKVFREVRTTAVIGAPAVWSVYNMGYIVKTRESLFSIDLVHRRAEEMAPFLDFELVTHNHGDHFHPGLYRELNRSGKTVISNFLDNYGAADWKKGGSWFEAGGYTRAEKFFKVKDIEIRTSLVDHNDYLIDFTTAFEIKVGNWVLYHSGDCGNASKLRLTWGRPDLWLFFPGCGIDVAAAVKEIRSKRTIFGHLWELGHGSGRLSTSLINAARAKAASVGETAEVPMWGDRIN